MLPNRIRISSVATEILKQVKARTGITPNILARFALAQSLEDAGEDIIEPSNTNGSEFNLITLLGEYKLHYEALLRQRYGEIDEGAGSALVAAHIERGMHTLRRVRSPADLLDLL